MQMTMTRPPEDQTILAQLHANLWDTIRFLAKVDTAIVLLASIFDFVMIAFLAGMKSSNMTGYMTAALLVLVVGVVVCLLLLSNRRVHRTQVEALKNMYGDLNLLKYFPDRETFMYSRRSDLYVLLIVVISCGSLALGSLMR